jgi:hypothetical protein
MAGSLVACLLVVTMLAPAPFPAVAQNRDHRVEATPQAGARLTSVQVSGTPTGGPWRPPPTADVEGVREVLLLIVVGLATLCAVIGVLAWIGWRATRTGAMPPLPKWRRSASRAREAERPPRRRPLAAATPPDAALEWAAEIEWHHEPGGGSRFCIVASRNGARERTAVSESEPLGWPPTGPESVDALRHAVEQLEAGAVAAGWRPAPPGEAWYAKRFTWQPTRVPPLTPRR